MDTTAILAGFISRDLIPLLAECGRRTEITVQDQQRKRYPRQFTGQKRWAEMIANLSEALDPVRGWKHVEIDNCNFLRDPTETCRLVVASAHVLPSTAGARLRIKQKTRPFRAASIFANDRNCAPALFPDMQPQPPRADEYADDFEEAMERSAVVLEPGRQMEPWTIFLLVGESNGRLVVEAHLLRSPDPSAAGVETPNDEAFGPAFLLILDEDIKGGAVSPRVVVEPIDPPPPTPRPPRGGPGFAAPHLPAGVPPSFTVELRPPSENANES